jgi:hypothetical protein
MGQSPWETNIAHLVKFTFFYGNRRFITALTRARHRSLSWTTLIQSTPIHPFSLISFLILSSHIRLGLPSGLFTSDFPSKILYHFWSPSTVLHAPPSLPSLIWAHLRVRNQVSQPYKTTHIGLIIVFFLYSFSYLNGMTLTLQSFTDSCWNVTLPLFEDHFRS